ncbi:hypothetical protein [Nannocystis pusilla]|uniref:Uncharacterized protein n=1 Tax=Nannocystis pusilla TaxID=889268 RepID=A0ABS7U0S5_9BACT|nr:hypothetical protein [Nannocystis pusilla]MBZ5713942.1 hypothetical protein [Nannocystis pusilla]
MLHLPRSAARRLLVVVVAACSATASAEPPVPRAFDECIQLRKAGKPREALPRCRAAYDALPLATVEEALHDRSLVVWETHYTYEDAQGVARDPALLCEEVAFLRAYLAFLDTHVSVDTRPADRRDAKRLLKDLGAALGDHRCEIPEVELVPVHAVAEPRVEPPPPAPPPSPPPPARAARPLRVSGGVFLGAGIVLASVTAIPLTLGEAAERQHSLVVNGAYPMGHVPKDVLEADAQLAATGVRLNRIAGGLVAAAGAALIAGITMLAVDGHRHRRAQRFAQRPRVRLAGPRLAVEF